MLNLSRSSATRLTINLHLLQLCTASLLLFLFSEACSFGDAQVSCNSAGSMSCRTLLQTADYADELTMGAMMNITVPAEIAAPSDSRLLVALSAVGHQRYMYNGTAWVLYNATAWLYEEEANASQQHLGKAVMGTHFYLPQPDASGGQPSWQFGSSRVTARSVAKATVDSDSITWNLLQATSHQMIIRGDESSSSDSSNWVGDVGFVQRLDTQRGLPPSSSSTSSIGDTYSSVYAALYTFYTTSASST